MMKRNIAFRMCVLLFCGTVLLSMMVTWHASGHLLDSDASSELVLAEHLAETGRIMSEDWYYSTELRVVNTQLVFAPLFHIFDDWRLIRFTGAMILQGILVASYYFFTRCARMTRQDFLLGGALLLLPAGIACGRIVLWHSYYVPHIAFGFVIVGLFLKAERSKGWVSAAALFALSLLSGLGGIRQGMITHVPLVLVVVLWMFDLQKQHDSVQELLKGCRKLIFLAVLACVGFALGYLINSEVLAKVYKFNDYSTIKTKVPDVTDLDNIAYSYLLQFGFRYGVKVFSIMGILSLGGLAAGMVSTAEAVIALRPDSEVELGAFTVRRFFSVCTGVMLCVFLFSTSPTAYSLYLIPVCVWSVPMIVHGLGSVKAPMRRLVLLTTVAAMLVSGLGNAGFVFSPNRFAQRYEGLGWKDEKTVKKISGVVDFLKENDCTLAYADFWSANIVTELTDGQVRMIPLTYSESGNSIRYYRWLTLKELWNEPMEMPYVVVGKSEWNNFGGAHGYECLTQVYEDKNFRIYRVDDNEAFRNILEQ